MSIKVRMLIKVNLSIIESVLSSHRYSRPFLYVIGIKLLKLVKSPVEVSL